MKRSRRDWSRVVADHAASGKSVQEYCQSEGIHPNTFYKNRKTQGHAELVEIRPRSNVESAAIVLNIGRYSMMIGSGFDPQLLKSVLEVIGELQ